KGTGSADHAGAIADIVDRRVSGGFITHQQTRVDGFDLFAVQAGVEDLRGSLAAAASTVAVLGQADGWRCHSPLPSVNGLQDSISAAMPGRCVTRLKAH